MNTEETNLEVKMARLDTKLDYAIAEIKDLKDNLAGRIDKLELGKFPSSDFVRFRNEEFVPLREKVEANSRDKWLILGGIGIITFLVCPTRLTV